jgi:hypothetical protein
LRAQHGAVGAHCALAAGGAVFDRCTLVDERGRS